MLGVLLFWVGCPLSHGWRRASVSAAASVGDGRSPLGCITRAGRRECPPVGGGEGTPIACYPAPGKPPSRCPTGRERRGKAPVSLAFFWLTPTKGKAVGLCPTTRNPLKRVDLNFTWLPFLLSFFPQHIQCLHQLLLLHPAQLRGFHRLLQVLLHPPQLLFL